MTSTKESQSLFAWCFFFVFLLHPHTLFSLNHQLNCIADFFCFHCICLLPCCCWYALFLLEFMQFLLCRSRELSAFISRFLSSLPAEYFAMFSCSFFRYFGSLVLASFSGRDIDQIFAQPQFYNHDYFPAKQQQREAENVNKLVSVLLCCTPHSLPLPLCLLQLLLPPIQLQAAPSSTNSFLHNVLLEKRDNVMTSKQFPPPGGSS